MKFFTIFRSLRNFLFGITPEKVADGIAASAREIKAEAKGVFDEILSKLEKAATSFADEMRRFKMNARGILNNVTILSEADDSQQLATVSKIVAGVVVVAAVAFFFFPGESVAVKAVGTALFKIAGRILNETGGLS